MADAIEEKIKAIVAEILEIAPETLADMEQFDRLIPTIDSVAMLEIMVTVERTYKIHISEDEVRTLTQWRQLLELVRKKTSPPTTPA